MITFLDGPAAGVSLMLRRAPKLLRATCARNGKWDALDQLVDEPTASEAIHVYALASDVRSFHLLIRGKGKKAGGFYVTAEYRHVAEQPADEHVRTTEAWRAWCWANGPRLMAAIGRVEVSGSAQAPPDEAAGP